MYTRALRALALSAVLTSSWWACASDPGTPVEGAAGEGGRPSARSDGGSGSAGSPRSADAAAAGATADGGIATGGTGAAPKGGSGGTAPSPLHVEGNLIKDGSGKAVILKGVDVIDLGGAFRLANGLRGSVDLASTWPGVKVIRLAVYPPLVEMYPSPHPFRAADADAYFSTVLGPAVDYVTGKGLYAIVDWHDIANVADEQHAAAARAFWSYVAPKLAGNPGVIFEAFNEPTDDDPQKHDSLVRWQSYQPNMQSIIDTIRRGAPDNLILVGTPIWSGDPGPCATHPMQGTNLAYVLHVYNANWLDWLKPGVMACASRHPIFMSEWGDYGTTPGYPESLKQFAVAHHFSWTAWSFSPDWKPNMLEDGGTPNAFGRFVQSWLAEIGTTP